MILLKNEVDIVVGEAQSGFNQSTLGTPVSPATITAVTGTSPEGGLIVRHMFSPVIGISAGGLYRTVTWAIAQSSNGTTTTSTNTETVNEAVGMLNLILRMGPHFYLFGGGEYWSANATSMAGTGTQANVASSAVYASQQNYGTNADGGLGIDIKRVTIVLQYSTAATVTKPVGGTNATQSSYGAMIGLRLF